MLKVYKIDQCNIVDEPLEDLMENDFRHLIKLTVSIDIDRPDSFLQDLNVVEEKYCNENWPIYVKGKSDWGRMINYTHAYEENRVNQTCKVKFDFFIRMFEKDYPQQGDHFAFLNQYDKRIANEEIIEVVDNCESEKPITLYEINQDNKLEQTDKKINW